MEFPNESQIKAAVRATLSREFDYTARMLRFWVEMEKDQWLQKSTLPLDTIHLAMALHTQACRQMRTIIEECSRCESFGADVATRCLFETVLALVFVLKPKVHIVCKPVMKDGKHKATQTGILKYSAKCPDKKDRKSKSNLLPHHLRTNLYLSHIQFQHQTHARKCMELPGAKRVGQSLAKLIDIAQVAKCEASIGPIWTYILRESGYYSGLNVADLARLLHSHLFRWYVKMYGPQSSFVHGTMAIVHLQINSDGSLGAAFLSDPVEVHRVLLAASLLFRILMNEMQQDIGIGIGAATAIEQFQVEFDQIFLT